MVDEQFTERAEHVITLAVGEAARLNHRSAGPEHLLLGLIIERQSVAATALKSLGVDLEDLREHIEQVCGHGSQPYTEIIALNESANKALELSRQEAQYMGHPYVGSEHILLGLLREEKGIAARVLAQHGVYLVRASWCVQDLLLKYQFGKRHTE